MELTSSEPNIQPLISIITPSLNRANFIGEAIKSVLEQGYPNFEHIIMDGGSTDGTLDILREFPHLRVISQPDTGMYDAINKGLKIARGEIIGLLNTDDLYAPGCLVSVAEVFGQHAEGRTVVGGADIFSDETGTRKIQLSHPTISANEFWFRIIVGAPVSNAWFFHKEVFAKVGDLDTSYRYIADRELLVRIGLAGIRPIPVARTYYLYRRHADSATINPLDSRLPERGLFRIKVLKEGTRFADSYLKRDNLPPEVRSQMKNGNGKSCYRLAATAFYHRQFADMFHAIRQGWKYDLFWPVLFIKMALERIKKPKPENEITP